MNCLRVTKGILIAALLMFWGVSHAEDTLYIFVFKNGTAQQDITVKVGEVEGTTNAFGLANFALPEGEYEVGYYQNGELFALTEVTLLENQQSQIFLSLTSDGAEVDLDLPLAAYQQDFSHEDVKKQEGPKGLLHMTILDARNDQPVPGAKLFFRGYALEATSDEQGIARVELVEDEYDISVIHPKYIMNVIQGVGVTVNQTTEETVKLTQSDIVMSDYVVSAPAVEGSLASSLNELKDSDVVADAISSEQFGKSGDSSASSALKRVTGITVVDGKFVYIRGLGERYSTVLLNDLHVPSPEPTKRVVPLDIFPTDVIQSMTIQKTYTSDLPGTFAGGTVLITTKDIPEEDNFISGSVGLSYNDSTGEDAYYNSDNDRGLPDIILDFSDNFGVLTEEVKIGNQVIADGLTREEKEALNKAMVNYRSYGLQKRTIEPGKSASTSFGQSFKTSGGLKYGFAGSLYYKTDEDAEHIKTNEYQYDPFTDENIHIEQGEFDVTTLKEKYGGLVSVGLDNLDGQEVKYTLLALNETGDRTNFGTKDKLIEDTFHERTFLQYTEESLLGHQLNGKHQLGETDGGYLKDIVLNWGAETAKATRQEPGTFEYEYKQSTGQMVLDAKKLFYLYSDLEDEVDNYRLDLSLPFTFNQQKNYTNIGFFDYSKSRNLDNRRFKIKYDDNQDPSEIDEALTEENVNNGTIDVLDSYKPDDFYTADQSVTAFYINQLISPFESLDVNVGFRQEDSTQALQVGAEQTTYSLDTNDLLPALGATWRVKEGHQLRFAYSKTVSRPDFREFSPNRYKDPLTGDIIFGYEGLKYTTISNYDIKYEWYPSFDEFFSVALFAKDFVDPIETVRTISDVEIETSYRNAQSAQSLGVELGFRKKLDRLTPRLQHFYVSGNYTFIDSEINLDKDAPENANDQFIPFLTTEERPMQGQSPYVVNFQLGYDNFFTRRSASFLFNVYGERIAALGINGNPDVYEQPFEKLDFVMKWGLNDTYDEQKKKIGYTLTFKANNLLDSDITMKQGDVVSFSRSPGRSYSLSFSMKF